MEKQLLHKQVAIVTGSSRGIGKAVATALIAQGARVVLNGQEADPLWKTEQEFLEQGADVVAIKADVSVIREAEYLIEQALDAYGRIDILINNAGLATRGSTEEIAPYVFQKLTETNFLGSVYPTQCALPYLRKSKGHVIFINSICGFRGIPYSAAYCSTKMAQAGFAESLRTELKGTGVHVGVAFVGFTQNDPCKTILDTNGKPVLLPARTNVKLASQAHVASCILAMLKNRQPKIILSTLGKATYWVQRLFPGIVDYFFEQQLEKIRDGFSYIGGKSDPSPMEQEGNLPLSAPESAGHELRSGSGKNTGLM